MDVDASAVDALRRKRSRDGEMARVAGQTARWFQGCPQFPIGRYFADFACRERMRGIECGESPHADGTYDHKRNKFMNLNGWSIVRFCNTDLMSEREAVLEIVAAGCEARLFERTLARGPVFLPAGMAEQK